MGLRGTGTTTPAEWAARLYRLRIRPLRYAAWLASVSLGLSGFTLVPDIDPASHEKVPTYNNASLNDDTVTATALVLRADLAQRLVQQVPGVHYAAVLQRHRSLFVGIDDRGAQGSRPVNRQRVRSWIALQEPWVNRIYISTNPTLVNHFHRYAADRAAHLHVSSDIVMGDIEREFPGAH